MPSWKPDGFLSGRIPGGFDRVWTTVGDPTPRGANRDSLDAISYLLEPIGSRSELRERAQTIASRAASEVTEAAEAEAARWPISITITNFEYQTAPGNDKGLGEDPEIRKRRERVQELESEVHVSLARFASPDRGE